MKSRRSGEEAAGAPFHLDRRDFGRMAITGTLGAAAFLGSSGRGSAGGQPDKPGIKLCAQSSARPSEEQLLFLKQIGAEYVSVASTPELRNSEGFLRIKKQYADAGITVWNIGNTGSCTSNARKSTLEPTRQRLWKRSSSTNGILRDLGKAGIRYTTYAHMGNGIWSSGRAVVRGASAREFDLASPKKKGVWAGKSWQEPLSHGREFTPEEIWDNYTHFIKQVAPVAEEAGVRTRIRQMITSVPVLAGVPRCIFGLALRRLPAPHGGSLNSPNVGICLCCGTWLEGGRRLTGKDPEEMIRHFGAEKIWKIHFRNVSAPLPHFVETFMDDGYYDMYRIMKSLRDVDFGGIVILDHSPNMVGGNYAQTAYGVGYMRARLGRANAEVKS